MMSRFSELHAHVHQLMLKATLDGFWLVDLQGHLLEVNPKYCEMSGYTEQELLCMRITDLEARESPVEIASHIMRIVGQHGDRFESCHRRKDGSTFEVEVSVQYQASDGGRMVFFLRDITERKLASEKLRAIHDDLQATLDAIPDLLFEVDLNGRIFHFHTHRFDLLATPPEVFLGKTFADVLPVDVATVCQEAIDETVREGWSFGKSYSLHLPQGEHWFELSCSLKSTQPNQLQRVIVIARNITERVLAEKTLVENERLSAIGEMTAGVAHDFNNALQGIVGSLEIAQLSHKLHPDIDEAIEVAKKCAADAAARIRQLQRFTKKRAHVGYVPLHVNELLKEAVLQTKPLWKSQADKQGLRIDIQNKFDNVPAIAGEEGELSSVFHNILKNAFEAMPDGGTITLETSRVAAGVLVRITDTGIGMNDETRKRVFQPFFSTKGLSGGRGLGMSAVYSIIRDHGGNITIPFTAPGQGTTFDILFPPGNVLAATNESNDTDPALNIPARILLVDDEEELQRLGQRMLTLLGHQVSIAGNGPAALALLEKHDYDIMVSDIGMPGMNGWQLAAIVQERHPRTIVAVLTGWATDDFADDAVTAVDYVLAKPVGVKALKKLVADCMKARR